MAYKVLMDFSDLQDDNFVYRTGDVFPRKGKSATDERLAELSSDKNRMGHALIKEVKTSTKEKSTRGKKGK